MSITLKPNGSVEWVGDAPFTLPVTNVRKRRVSRIVPVNLWKRVCFRLLRLCFGDEGRVAKWTRTWSGPWRGRILATGETFEDGNRLCVIAWEIVTLESNTAKFDL